MGKKLPSKTAKKRAHGDAGAQSALRAPISFFCLSFVFLCFFFPLLPFFLLLSSPYFLPSLFFFFFFFFFFSLSFTLLPFFLSISLFADRAQGARSFNGGPNAAPILAEGGGGVPKYRISRKIGRIFRGRKSKKRPRKLWLEWPNFFGTEP